jgi:altronate hydrolase
MPGHHADVQGYRRANGRVGTRNLWVLNTVGCVNHAAEQIARQAGERSPARSTAFTRSPIHMDAASRDDLSHTQHVLAV